RVESIMHDEFRVQVKAQAPGELLDALKAVQVADDARREQQRLAITHEGEHIFMYADSAEAAEQAREVVAQAMAEHAIAGEVSVMRWHPLEERWEDAAAPLPATDAERAAEHGRLEEIETEESEQLGEPEWEVYVTLPTHHDARAFAARLRGEGIPTKQLWHHLLVGANDEDDAAALAGRLRAEAPAGSQIHAQGNGMEYWRMLHPYAYLGGIGN
ncbi:MAG TPA: hypothetical protein VNV37_03170, partial [Solirubrobacteraceae bacterium]|nr:hypothetical protein [Solirubrobacteraceae bacterium]